MQYDFPSQEIVIQFVIEAIQAEAFNPKTLFLIGSYTIGIMLCFMFWVFWCFSKLGSFLISVLVCRKRKIVYGGCSFASEENICWSCKAANTETFRASSGDYALVYSQ